MTVHWTADARRGLPPTPTMLLTADETARELRIAKRRVWDLIRDGHLASVKIGKSRRISRAAIEEYVRNLQASE